jgi:predicted nucleotide-binding protein (sugar kinase/HSP70/actin superfamily)
LKTKFNEKRKLVVKNMVKVSLPNMGNAWVAFKTLLESVPTVEVILPPPVTRKTIEVGAKYSPEFVCFPFKVNLGDFILTHEQKGIDTFITALDCGPCRFGFYHTVQKRILKDLGYDLTIIPLDQMDLLEFKWLKVLDRLSPERNPLWKALDVATAIRRFLSKARYVQDLEQLESYYRCREMKKGSVGPVMTKLMLELDRANSVDELRIFRKTMLDTFAAIPIYTDVNPLRVMVSGEIHITLEPYVNLDIRKKLGEMGIEVHQDLSLLDWVLHKFHVNYRRKALERISKPYLKLDIGGEAQWVLAEYIECYQKGFDGFVHLYPFTCMPEVYARSVITAMDEPKSPILFFSFDEHSGSEGMKTRLEAFSDLMESRRNKRLQGNSSLPSPNHIPSLLKQIQEVPVMNISNPLDIFGSIASFIDKIRETKPEEFFKPFFPSKSEQTKKNSQSSLAQPNTEINSNRKIPAKLESKT